MARQRVLKSQVANSRELLRLIHLGQRHGSQRAVNAADSLRSLLAYNLTHETIVIPAQMIPYWETLNSLEK